MSSEVAKGDQNHYRTITGVTNDANQDIKIFRVDPTSLGLIVAGTMMNGGYTSVTSGTATGSSTTVAAGVVGISTPCKKVTITVPTTNTGQEVCVGGSNVSAVLGSEIGHILITGSSQDFYIADASNLYWIPNTVGDKISFNIWA